MIRLGGEWNIDEAARKLGVGRTREVNKFFKRKTEAGMDWLSDYLDNLAKNVSGAGKSMFGKSAGMVNFATKLIGNLIAPGAGSIVSGLLTAVDTAKQNKDLNKLLKTLGKDAEDIIPERYKGTFLESYLKGGIGSALLQQKQQTKGVRDTKLALGVLSSGLDLIPGIGKLSKGMKAAKAAIPGRLEVPGPDMVLQQPSKFQPLSGLTGAGPEDYRGLIAGDTSKGFMKKGAGNLLGALTKTPGIGGYIEVMKALDKPLLTADPVVKAISTPTTYSGLLQNPLLDWMIGEQEEPSMAEMKAPKLRGRY